MRTFRSLTARFRLLVSLLAVSALTTLLLQSRCGDLVNWRLVRARENGAAETSTPPVTHRDLRHRNSPPVNEYDSPTASSTNYNPTRTTYSRKQSSVSMQKRILLVENDAVSRVMTNLDKCLSAANLTEYFIRKNFLFKARRNAEYFITTLREVVPSAFSSNYSSPCWKMNLTVSYCNSSSLPSCPLPAIKSNLGSHKYINLQYLLESDLTSALTTRYPQGVSYPLVCLPKVFLAGFPKCGSSYLFCMLEALLAGAGGGIAKEPHFWVPRGPFELQHQSPHRLTSLVPYLLNFLPTIEAELNSEFSLPIDASPNLLFQWNLYRHGEGVVNYCLAPAVLPEILPHSKFIVVMRNPVDMLYSAFWYSCSDLNVNLREERKLRMPHEFHEKVQKKIQIFENCTQFAPVDKCMENVFRKLEESLDYCGRIRLEIGFYFLHIRKWLAVVPREQFLFLRTEDFDVGTTNITKRISNFLGLSVETPGTKKYDFQRRNLEGDFCSNVQTRYDYHRDPRLKMRSDTRKILSDLYRPYNRALATLLNDSRYLWT